MTASLKNLNRNLAAILLFVWLPIESGAQEQTELLERLRVAPTEEAMQLEHALVLIWSRSGSAAMDLLLDRGRRAIRAGDYDTAIDHLTALTDHAPGFAEGWNARATAYYYAGNFGQSIADISRTLALNPNHFGAMAGLASILEQTDEFEQALKVNRQIEAIHPSRPGLRDAIKRLENMTGGTEL